ncbi:hypothetical protein [Nonomuraea dietziae]|uniref:hypothetical protein n=1 Tax=Nonomuraea dietziae TaxID=65515 RepID=UPI003441A3D0
MSDPPSILILPDQAASLMELLVDENDEAIKAKVSWIENIPGYRGGLKPREEWLPIDQVAPVPGQSYTSVPRTPAAQPEPELEPAVAGPHGWPAQVPAPGVPGWEKHALAWLYDQVPADYRQHPVLADYPIALAWAAILHLQHDYRALVVSYRCASFELKAHLPPEAVESVLATTNGSGNDLSGAGRRRGYLSKPCALRPAQPVEGSVRTGGGPATCRNLLAQYSRHYGAREVRS